MGSGNSRALKVTGKTLNVPDPVPVQDDEPSVEQNNKLKPTISDVEKTLKISNYQSWEVEQAEEKLSTLLSVLEVQSEPCLERLETTAIMQFIVHFTGNTDNYCKEWLKALQKHRIITIFYRYWFLYWENQYGIFHRPHFMSKEELFNNFKHLLNIIKASCACCPEACLAMVHKGLIKEFLLKLEGQSINLPNQTADNKAVQLMQLMLDTLLFCLRNPLLETMILCVTNVKNKLVKETLRDARAVEILSPYQCAVDIYSASRAAMIMTFLVNILNPAETAYLIATPTVLRELLIGCTLRAVEAQEHKCDGIRLVDLLFALNTFATFGEYCEQIVELDAPTVYGACLSFAQNNEERKVTLAGLQLFAAHEAHIARILKVKNILDLVDNCKLQGDDTLKKQAENLRRAMNNTMELI